MSSHVHINTASVLVVFLSVVVTLGTANLLAMKYQGHPAADAWLDLFGRGA